MEDQAADPHVLEPVRMLLTGAIDYAGLYPPAGLSMPEAVINYAMYRNSNYNWLLGRFVVGIERLSEFYAAARDFISRDAHDSWRLSVVVGDNVFDAIRRIEDFNAANGPSVVCDMIETRGVSTDNIERVSQALPAGLAAYFEIAPANGFADLVAAAALSGQRAKIRTGGVTTDAFPDASAVVRFVQACVGANLPFKATAGLHHPIRCFRPLTYASDSPKGTMHGFLNMFLMTGFAREAYRRSFLEDVMEDEFEEVFQFDPVGVKWRNEYTLNLHQIERLRTLGIQSFGSCSFDEPLADLQSLGIL